MFKHSSSNTISFLDQFLHLNRSVALRWLLTNVGRRSPIRLPPGRTEETPGPRPGLGPRPSPPWPIDRSRFREQHAVDLEGTGALKGLDEGLAEVFAEESVEDWIQRAVGIAEDGDDLEDEPRPVRYVAEEENCRLKDPVWQPANDVDGDDG